MADSIVQSKSRHFAIRIVNLYKFLKTIKNEYTMSQQLLRAGTSIGANIAEAEFAISKKEFISKMQIALKESAEVIYWLDILYNTEYITKKQYDSINADCMDIFRMLQSIVKKAKDNDTSQ